MCAITKEEKEMISKLLEPQSKILSIAFTQVWKWVDVIRPVFVNQLKGALCIIKNYNDKAYYFRLYCLKYQQIMWEEKIQSSIKYYVENQVLHSYSLRGFLMAYNFYDKMEAKEMYNTIFSVIKKMKQDMKTKLKELKSFATEIKMDSANKEIRTTFDLKNPTYDPKSLNHLRKNLTLNLKAKSSIKLDENQDRKQSRLSRVSFVEEAREIYDTDTSKQVSQLRLADSCTDQNIGAAPLINKNPSDIIRSQKRMVSMDDALRLKTTEISLKQPVLNRSKSMGSRQQKLTADDVGPPTDFKHYIHIEWTGDKKDIVQYNVSREN